MPRPARTGNTEIDETTQQLLDEGWEYSELAEDGGGRVMVLTKDDERFKVSLGISTVGGLRAFIGMDAPGTPLVRREIRDRGGNWISARIRLPKDEGHANGDPQVGTVV